MKKILITGGSGFIGSRLAPFLEKVGNEVVILDSVPPKQEMPGVSFIKIDLLKEPVPREAVECDAIIHLAGVNIFGRWNKEYKQLILDSRVKTAYNLIEAVKKSRRKPKVFVSASAVGYYGDRGEEELDESSPPGNDFLAYVCKEWERAAKAAENVGMRSISIRTGIVLGPNRGIIAKLIPIFKLGLGGPIRSGNQWFSWIAMDDILEVYKTAVFDERIRGPINAVSPNPVRNRDFAKILGKILHRPAIIPAPKFVLRLVLGELAEVVIASQKVKPKKLQALGFSYKYPDIEKALERSLKN